MCHFRAQNDPFVLNNFFLVQTIIITFIYLLAIFIVQNLQKILTVDPKLWGCTIFGSKMVHLLQTISVLQIINIIFFHCTKFQKNPSGGSRVMMRNFGAQNGPFAQMRIFFSENLLMELVPFILPISTCQKSKSDINLLVKYWRLKNTKISLAESHLWIYLRTRSFSRMQFSQNVNEP